MPVARHDDVELIANRRDRELVGWLDGGLCGGQRPGTDARILLSEDGDGGSEADEDQCTNWGDEIDGINVADSNRGQARNCCDGGNQAGRGICISFR